MKTQKFFFFLLVFSISWISTRATIHHVYLDNTYNTEWHTFCGGVNDTVILHKPIIAMNNITWVTPLGLMIFAQDTVIVPYNNQGDWYFSSTEVGKDVYVYFISTPPVQPACMAHDTSFCTASINWTLNAQNTSTFSTYLWDNGATTKNRIVTTVGTYWVQITNACGQRTDTLHITQSNPNAPHLGADQSFCWGSGTILNPGSTNVTSYQWSTGAITPTITVDTTGTYWVYVIDGNGCSGRDTIQVTTLIPIGEEECYVGFDTLTWKNDVNWTVNLPGNADSVRIYKETSLNVWTLIGTVSKTVDHFLDMASLPQQQSYSYKIALVDTCGNESNLSSFHTTISLLSAYDQPSNTYGFTWSAYDGIIVNDYYLYGIYGNGTVTQVGSVPGNQFMFNYLNPDPGFVKYFVGFETPDCDAKTNIVVKSNWVLRDSLLTSVHEVGIIPFAVYPNPASSQLTINIGVEDFQVNVLTTIGQVVLSEHNVKTLDVSSLSKGLYIMQVTANGTTSEKKIIIN